ncbi:MAG: hypothetical protein JOZ09_16820 [Pseudonocardiales bacterium]|nr:hypothetical protein [Pseudonocardiales bacterium]
MAAHQWDDLPKESEEADTAAKYRNSKTAPVRRSTRRSKVTAMVTVNRQRGVVDQADRWHGCSAHLGDQKASMPQPSASWLRTTTACGPTATLFPAQDIR